MTRGPDAQEIYVETVTAAAEEEGNTFTRVGEALWGKAWMDPMAQALQVRRDTVQDYKQGRRQPAPAQWDLLNEIINKRRVLLRALALATEQRCA